MKVARHFSLLLGALSVGGATLLLAGCPSSSQGGGTATTAGTTTGTAAGGSKTLTIISPHLPIIQTEFEQLWKSKYPDIALQWRGQSGTSEDLNMVRQQFQSSTKEKGIGVDLFFGGGAETFNELESDGYLVKLPSTYGIPAKLGDAPLHGKDNTWVAAALSNFGILYNKEIAARDGLPVPKTWADLTNPKLRDRIELADPRKSGSAATIYEIILQTNGWDKGWKILTAMCGNAHSWARSSSAPLQDVQNGEAVFTTAIDFYAFKTIAASGSDKLAYSEPSGQTLVTADPIGILPGAPNPDAAKKFIALVLSPEGQKLWFYAKGSQGGPKNADLYRLPALPSVYKGAPKNALRTSDPYTQKALFTFDSDKASVRRNALNDLIGVTLVDNFNAIRAAWEKNPNVDATGFVPISEAEFMKVAAKWNDATTANEYKDKWGSAARTKFAG